MVFAILQNKSLNVQIRLTKVKEFCDAVEREGCPFGEICEATVRASGTKVHEVHEKVQAKEPFVHTTSDSTAKFWTIFFCQTEQISRP